MRNAFLAGTIIVCALGVVSPSATAGEPSRLFLLADGSWWQTDLEALRLNVDEASLPGGDVYIYATDEERALLDRLDWSYLEAPDEYPGKNDPDYIPFDQMETELKAWARDYPEICQLVPIGKSGEGRTLWFVKISDHVAEEEAEPRVKYVANMHGDEVVGREMMLRLIPYLLGNYGKITQVTELVDNTELWIMPSLNPDGFTKKSRTNAQFIDLNRDFPDPDTVAATDEGRRIYEAAGETSAMVAFSLERNFTWSANFHGGALVVNIPWDRKRPTPLAPDFELFMRTARTYTRYNQAIFNGGFSEGITVGYKWYSIYGGMQDWSYRIGRCPEVTIELSATKWPRYSDIPRFWEENRDALLAYAAEGCRGVSGVVTDAVSGQPVSARVRIMELGVEVPSGKKLGDFHRVLFPGNYTLEITAPGYQSAKIAPVLVKDQPRATEIMVALTPASLVPPPAQEELLPPPPVLPEPAR